jgi:hypothetical protein
MCFARVLILQNRKDLLEKSTIVSLTDSSIERIAKECKDTEVPSSSNVATIFGSGLREYRVGGIFCVILCLVISKKYA